LSERRSKIFGLIPLAPELLSALLGLPEVHAWRQGRLSAQPGSAVADPWQQPRSSSAAHPFHQCAAGSHLAKHSWYSFGNMSNLKAE
jgi:hypothetical protein